MSAGAGGGEAPKSRREMDDSRSGADGAESRCQWVPMVPRVGSRQASPGVGTNQARGSWSIARQKQASPRCRLAALPSRNT